MAALPVPLRGDHHASLSSIIVASAASDDDKDDPFAIMKLSARQSSLLDALTPSFLTNGSSSSSGNANGVKKRGRSPVHVPLAHEDESSDDDDDLNQAMTRIPSYHFGHDSKRSMSSSSSSLTVDGVTPLTVPNLPNNNNSERKDIQLPSAGITNTRAAAAASELTSSPLSSLVMGGGRDAVIASPGSDNERKKRRRRDIFSPAAGGLLSILLTTPADNIDTKTATATTDTGDVLGSRGRGKTKQSEDDIRARGDVVDLITEEIAADPVMIHGRRLWNDHESSAVLTRVTRQCATFPLITNALTPMLPREMIIIIGHYSVSIDLVGAECERRGSWREALPYYQASLEYYDSPQAAYKIGLMYVWGMNAVRIDLRRGVNYLRRAASQGHSEAASMLSFQLERSEGFFHGDDTVHESMTQGTDLYSPLLRGDALLSVERTPDEHQRGAELCAAALPLLKALALGGDARAQFTVGFCYDSASCGVGKNAIEGSKWLHMAAQQGVAQAQHDLGCSYRDGDGVSQSDMEAARWFRLCTAQGDPKGKIALGHMLESGRVYSFGPRQDLAFQFYLAAAEDGHPVAQWNVGLCLRDGLGVIRDNDRSWHWIIAAARAGEPDATAYAEQHGLLQGQQQPLPVHGQPLAPVVAPPAPLVPMVPIALNINVNVGAAAVAFSPA